MEITRQQYEFALARIEELLPIVDDQTAVTDRNAVELVLLSDIVIEYESIHFPIEKPTIAELMELALEERKMTRKSLGEIKTDFPSVDYVGNQRYVFNIKGNKYRLVVVVKFIMGYVFIRFVGTHNEYDKMDCSNI